MLTNRKARFDYEIDAKTVEAGIMLVGTEVKSIRLGRANLTGAFVTERDGELWLVGMKVDPCPYARVQHEPLRARKLLLHKREINRLGAAIQREGVSLVLLGITERRGRFKAELGLGKGKKAADKRATIKDRDWKRQQDRLMKGR